MSCSLGQAPAHWRSAAGEQPRARPPKGCPRLLLPCILCRALPMAPMAVASPCRAWCRVSSSSCRMARMA